MEEEVVVTSENGNYELVERHYSDGSIDYYIKDEFKWSPMPSVCLDKVRYTDEYTLYVTTDAFGSRCNYDEACEVVDYLAEAVDFMGEVKDIVNAE